MAKGLPPLWFTQFLDNNGNVLSGGKIYTYSAGTTTNLATYSNAAGATNTNPVVLDSAGRANIYLTEDTAYKFVVKTSADVLVGTFDNITSRGAATTAALNLEVCVAYIGTPGTSAYMGGYVATRALSFPANFAGAYGKIRTNPGGSTAIDVQKNGVSVGTITVSAAGAYTFATTSGAVVTLAAGDKLEFISPSAATTGVDFMWTLVATVS